MTVIVRALVVLLAALITLIPAVNASAAPGDEDDDTTTTSLGWRQLGMGSTISFSSVNSPQNVSIPVPDGARPTTLTGQLQTAVNVTNGFVEIERGDGQILGTIRVPAFDAAQRAVPFSVNIAAVPVVNNLSDLRFVLRQNGGDAVCGPAPQLTLSNLAVSFSGQQQVPATVQEFFPPILSNATIYVDPQPTAAEQQTVLSLVAALTQHYHPIPLTVDVQPLNRVAQPPRTQFDNLSRSIVVQETADAGITVTPRQGSPYLAVTGPADALTEQVAMFRNNLLSIVQTSTATVNSADAMPVQGSNTVAFSTFGDIRRITVLGEGTLNTGFDPSAFALSRPGNVEVHLKANYTPVQDTEKASVLVQSGGRTIYTSSLDTSGRFDKTFSIPAAQVATSAPLTLLVSYEPAPGACDPRTVPMTFELDPTSTATAGGDAGAAGGFSALPLAFAPTFQVALGSNDPNVLSYAAAMIASVQRFSSTELRPILVRLDEAAGSGTGALIVADAAAVSENGLTPPLDARGDVSEIALPGEVAAQIPDGLGSIQAFAQNNRTVVLVTTSGAWPLVDPLFEYIAAQEQGLLALSGDVLAAGEAGVPSVLTIKADGLVAAPDTGDGWMVWAWIGAGLAVVVLLIAAVVFLIQRRRPAPGDSTPPVDGSTSV